MAFVVALLGAADLSAQAVLYSTMPSPLPPNTASIGYEAEQVSSFGDLIQLGDGNGPFTVNSLTIAISNWAYQSLWPGVGTSSGFTVPITLTVYSATAINTLGSLITSQTIDAVIPWRAEPSPACGANSTDYQAGDSVCYSGALSLLTFNLGGISVAGKLIYSVAFSTQDSGANPTRVPGPYNSLNFGATTSAPTAGSNPDSGFFRDGFYNSSPPFNYVGEVLISGSAPIAPLSIDSSSLPAGKANQVYSPVTMSASGGTGTFAWSGSGWPAGVSISPDGVVSGTPTQAGTFAVTVTVRDPGSGLVANLTSSITISVNSLAITSTGELGSFLSTANVSGALAASGGLLPYKWTATGLPAGFSLDSTTGAFSGVAGTPGAHTFLVTLTDAETPALTATQTIAYSVLGITTTSLPNGSAGNLAAYQSAGPGFASYSVTIAVAGGAGPYTFSAPGGLPAGLTLSPSGVISGTPTSIGTFTFTVVVTSGGLSASSTFTLTITGPVIPALQVSSTELPAGTVATPYATAAGLQATGGTPPYTWSVFGGLLPPGMSLLASGAPAGTPRAAGAYVFTAQVTDAKGATATGSATLTINPAALSSTLGSLPNGVVGTSYPAQLLTVSGGTAPYSFTLDTGSALPDGLSLADAQISGTPTKAGTFSFTVVVTDAGGVVTKTSSAITISPPQANLVLSMANISFKIVAGSSGVPSPAQVTVRSSVVSTILNYSYTLSSAAAWLNVTGGASTPGSLSLAIDPSAPTLAASATPYSTSITVTCVAPSPCAGTAQTVRVSLTVSAPPPQLTLSSTILAFNGFSADPEPSSQTLGLQNSGGGAITVNSVTPSVPWLSVSGVPAVLAAGPAVPLTITANPTGLSAGYYTATITVNSSSGTASLPVTLLIAQSLSMTLGPAGAQFSAPSGSSPGNPAGSFSVIAAGAGTANWTASVVSDSNWLTVNNRSGTSSVSATGAVSYALNPAIISNLAAASYYATIQVDAPGVVNSPQQYQVVLNISPATTDVNPQLSAGGLIFVTSATSTPAPQNISVYAGSASTIPFQASPATTDGAAWLTVTPSTASASLGSPGQSAVSVNPAGLAPGVYSGGVSYAFQGELVTTLNVTLLVLRSSLTPSARSGPQVNAEATGCTPTRLIGTQTGLYNNFAQSAGWPTPISIALINDCGLPVNGASMTATFSNGDPPLALSPKDASSGVYLGTWTPRSAATQVTVTATAQLAPFPVTTTLVTGQVRSSSVPILTPNAIFDVFNPVVGSGLAPGQVVQIYGTNLATQTIIAPTTPLPTQLGGTSVLIGGIPAPLYYVSPGQLNAQVPFQLNPGTQYQVLVQVNGALTTPAPAQLVTVSPGIANIGGQVIAQHAADYSLVTNASPAVPGEYLIVYLSGLGMTDNSVTTGAASPGSPLSHPVLSPYLHFNGASILPAFAGLTPSAVGLYQINFQVPADAPAGNLRLSVTQDTVVSNEGLAPVR